MYDHPLHMIGATDHHVDPGGEAAGFAAWLAMNGDSLAALASWLGGALWRARTERVCEAAGRGLVQPGAVRDLLDLFALTHVGDPDRIESALFAIVDLDHPNVHVSCVVAERLSRGLRAIAREGYDPMAFGVARPSGRAA